MIGQAIAYNFATKCHILKMIRVLYPKLNYHRHYNNLSVRAFSLNKLLTLRILIFSIQLIRKLGNICLIKSKT